MISETDLERIEAAKQADWQQVVLNGGPPCFHFEVERGRFCLRAERWFGHEGNIKNPDHRFVSLADLLSSSVSGETAEYKEAVAWLRIMRDRDKYEPLATISLNKLDWLIAALARKET